MVIPNSLVVKAYNLLSFFSTRNEAGIQRNLIKNKGSLANLFGTFSYLAEKKYIEEQALFSDISIGRSDLSRGGCAVIAVYNIMAAFGAVGDTLSDRIELLTDLIRSFEWDGIVRKGRLGVSPGAVKKLLIRKGCGVEFSTVTASESVNSLGLAHEAVIAMCYNKKGSFRDQIHYIAVTKENNSYIPHNIHAKAHPADTLNDALMQLSDKGPAVICLMGIDRPRKD